MTTVFAASAVSSAVGSSPPDLVALEWYVPARPARSTPSSRRATYRRRRVAALVAAAVVCTIVLVLVRLIGSWLGSALDSVPASAAERRPAPVTYTVQPGDTLWSIAARLDPGADQREVVAALIATNGGDVVRVGQALRL